MRMPTCLPMIPPKAVLSDPVSLVLKNEKADPRGPAPRIRKSNYLTSDHSPQGSVVITPMRKRGSLLAMSDSIFSPPLASVPVNFAKSVKSPAE